VCPDEYENALAKRVNPSQSEALDDELRFTVVALLESAAGISPIREIKTAMRLLFRVDKDVTTRAT